jgi:hypothetical protein
MCCRFRFYALQHYGSTDAAANNEPNRGQDKQGLRRILVIILSLNQCRDQEYKRRGERDEKAKYDESFHRDAV